MWRERWVCGRVYTRVCICVCVCVWVLTTVLSGPDHPPWFELSEALASRWQASHLTLQYQDVSQPKQVNSDRPTANKQHACACRCVLSCLVPPE